MQQDPKPRWSSPASVTTSPSARKTSSVPPENISPRVARGARRRRAGTGGAGPSDVGPVRRPEAAPGPRRDPRDAARTGPARRAHRQPGPRRRRGGPGRRRPGLDKTGATLVVVEHRLHGLGGPRGPGRGPAAGLHDGLRPYCRGPPDLVLARSGTSSPGWRLGTRVRPATRGRAPAPAGAGAAGGAPAGQLLLAERLAVSRERPRRAGLGGGFSPILPEPVKTGIAAQVRAGEALSISGPNGRGSPPSP